MPGSSIAGYPSGRCSSVGLRSNRGWGPVTRVEQGARLQKPAMKWEICGCAGLTPLKAAAFKKLLLLQTGALRQMATQCLRRFTAIRK